jgi:hypothetical protein
MKLMIKLNAHHMFDKKLDIEIIRWKVWTLNLNMKIVDKNLDIKWIEKINDKVFRHLK